MSHCVALYYKLTICDNEIERVMDNYIHTTLHSVGCYSIMQSCATLT